MRFNWRDFLLVSHDLRNKRDEGSLRTCISRTYYYVFNIGLIKARQLNFRETNPELHRILWDWCQKSPDLDMNKIGIIGNRLKSLRVLADYRDEPIPNLAGEVKDQLVRAQAFEAIIAKKNGLAPPVALTL